jgi:hypothetical protein
MSDYYQLLQVPRNADDETIRKSYRRLARLYHPDSNRARIASEHMRLLNAAYEVLGDPLKRRKYDERLAEAARMATAPRAQWQEDGSEQAPPMPSGAANPWVLWVGITALLIVIAFAGTLYFLRGSLPSISLALFATATRPATLLPPPTSTARPAALAVTTATATASPSPTPLPLPSHTRVPTVIAPSPTPRPTSTPSPEAPTPTRLATGPAYPLPAATAAAETRLVRSEFPNGPAGGGDIFVSSTEGDAKQNLTNSNNLSEISPSWSPFGQHIAFAEFNSGNLFVMTADGSLTTRLTSDTGVRDSNPVWAPVGSLIAYQSIARDAYAKGDTAATRVYVIDFDSRQRRQMGDQPGGSLNWSPDGKWLAYQVAVETGTTLYIVNADRPTQQYIFNLARLRRLAWTLDSRQLVFEAFVRDTNGDKRVDELDGPEIYLANLQPVSVQRLSGSVTVVSARGKFPGPPSDGEYYPPIVSVVRQ